MQVKGDDRTSSGVVLQAPYGVWGDSAEGFGVVGTTKDTIIPFLLTVNRR